ncbi:alpha/beta fold hydrolase [Saccharothrix violaceirubra]|uniref:Pimeloyl-ACP methyl ester carboxylesterase n=1 Tax=Saccharothrix violaceirubra TaxID=413306 RepID=A0A7W7T860_9PSEU|nr:alpha/beta hydrolase [Saccharothrix violaceirubra]MBB4968305.1 pimeloyl-ACP methyl ester carboxylesterase [Saccharothrix violaceirubra]
MYTQLSPHRAQRVDLPGRHGTIAALRAAASGRDLGATVLLLPGFTGSKEDFAPLVDPIADAGFEVVAVDLPGQYESAGSRLEGDYLPERLGADLVDVVGKLAAEGRRVLLVGHSYGGMVARGAVLAGAPTAGVTLMSTGPEALPPGDRRDALDLGETVLRAQGIEESQRLNEVRQAMNPRWASLPEELRDFYRTRFLRSSTAGLLGMGTGLRSEPDLVAKLSRKLRTSCVPCLVVCGEHDDAWSPASQRDMAERLDADFAVLPGVGHSPGTEAPDALLATLLPTWRAWLRP